MTAPSVPPRECRDPEPDEALALAHQLAPIAQRSADPAWDKPDRVRHVGRDWRQADGEQGREGQQRAGSDDRVQRPRGNAGNEDREGFERRHGRRSPKVEEEARRSQHEPHCVTGAGPIRLHDVWLPHRHTPASRRIPSTTLDRTGGPGAAE